MCSKHVEARNKFIVKQKFCASSWLITEITITPCLLNCITENIQVTEGRKYFPRGPHAARGSHVGHPCTKSRQLHTFATFSESVV